MKKLIFQETRTQYENAGDLLINGVLVDKLRHHGDLILNDRGVPDWYFKALSAEGVRPLSAMSSRGLKLTVFLSLLRHLFSGKVRHYLVLPPGHTSRRGWRAALRALKSIAPLAPLWLLGCRIVRVGFSIGPFDPVNARVEALATRFYYGYGLREKESYDHAIANGLRHVIHFPDLAWGYAAGSDAAAGRNDAPYVVFSFRSNSYGIIHDPGYLQPLIRHLQAILARPALRGMKVVVGYQVAYDRDASLQIRDALAAVADVSVIDEKLSLAKAAALYAGAACVISNRLHVLMLAGLAGSLPVALVSKSDNKKVIGIFADNGLDDVMLDLALSPELNAGQAEALLAKRQDVLSRFEARRQVNRAVMESVFADLF